MRTRFVVGAVMLCASLAAHADDLFTLTGGGNTITFTLPSSPIPTDTEDINGVSFFSIDPVSVDINGTVSSQAVSFYFGATPPAVGGGLSIESAGNGALGDTTTSGLLVDDFGPQLFTGDPTFLTGPFQLTSLGDDTFSDVNFSLDTTPVTAVTPEPSSSLLLGTGLFGIAGLMKRRIAGRFR